MSGSDDIQELRRKSKGKAFPFTHETCMELLDEIERLRVAMSGEALNRVVAAARAIDAPDETLCQTEAWSAVRDEHLRELRLALAALDADCQRCGRTQPAPASPCPKCAK